VTETSTHVARPRSVKASSNVSRPLSNSDQRNGNLARIQELPPAAAHLPEGFHMRSDIVPGAVFPDYELSDHTSKRRKLSELQGQHPMVLVLGRGGFCPKDRRQAEGLVGLHREMEVGYCRLVTISINRLHISRVAIPSQRT
jgi:hypothetical protein